MTSACYNNKVANYAINNWYRTDTSINETRKIMGECGYSQVLGAGYKSYDEIAQIHICMIENGFTYIHQRGHFCKEFKHLPACEEAREKGIIR